MKLPLLSISVTRRGCITAILCAIPLMAALVSVFITAAVFAHDVPRLSKGFPSVDYVDVGKPTVHHG